jgi:hypothetical protein
VLANLLRTDRHAYRPLPDDSHLGQAVSVLARAHQDLIHPGQPDRCGEAAAPIPPPPAVT